MRRRRYRPGDDPVDDRPQREAQERLRDDGDIDAAVARITVEGARYSESSQKLIDR